MHDLSGRRATWRGWAGGLVALLLSLPTFAASVASSPASSATMLDADDSAGPAGTIGLSFASIGIVAMIVGLALWAHRRSLARRRAALLPKDATRTPGSESAAPAANVSGRDAGRREVEALESMRTGEFSEREEVALQAQLARAPRDVGALFGLLQLHARRGDKRQVESFAHALWDETDAEGELWRRAATLGRGIDPSNPLYSPDPFTALAQHAAAQPVKETLALSAFDLSLPEEAMTAQAPLSNASSNLHPDIEPHSEGVPSSNAANSVPTTSPAFDLFNQPDARLPASFSGLDLDFDDLPDLPVKDSPPAKKGRG